VISSAASAADLLREARRKAGLTQSQLAARAGVAQSVVSAYETGTREPSLATLQRLVSATGLTLDLRVRHAPSQSRQLSGPLGRRVLRHRRAIRQAAANHGVTNIRVFGSVARGQDTADSDVDLLIDVGPGVGLLRLGRLEADLHRLLGARIDLVPSEGLKADVAEAVEADAVRL
jgi:predicted nucleotidyltransferase/DNA-binding XRE family transcriptional regulator